MGESSTEPLRGTIDLLVLKTLTLAPMHGWGISQRIQQLTNGALEVNQGSLYPALQRLERRDWIDSEWRVTESGRRAKYYQLTVAGTARRRERGGELAPPRGRRRGAPRPDLSRRANANREVAQDDGARDRAQVRSVRRCRRGDALSFSRWRPSGMSARGSRQTKLAVLHSSPLAACPGTGRACGTSNRCVVSNA